MEKEKIGERGFKNESGSWRGGAEVATADFTWVLYIPRGEVGLSAPPSDKGTEGEGGLCGEGGGVLSNSCPH